MIDSKDIRILSLFMLCATLIFNKISAQALEEDTVKTLEGVTVKAFDQKERGMTTALVSVIRPTGPGNRVSLLQDFNTIPGARMEERSPGSYRINIRGSSLRSPFGVRNVKIYWNDIPLTDPGGNTYFNQMAPNNFSSVEVFKGPASSLYGAGTGGLIILNNDPARRRGVGLEYVTGSYNLRNLLATAVTGGERSDHTFSFAHTTSSGYREQTQMRRDNFSWTGRMKLSDREDLTASLLYVDMYYQTPGALTRTEFEKDPRAARPAVGTFPSAQDAKAAIFQKTFLTGLSYRNQITKSLENRTSVYGAFAQVKNSAVRNFERRNEPHFGGRSVFNLETGNSEKLSVRWTAGIEFQQGYFNSQVAKNQHGSPDSLQTNDDIESFIYSIFTQATLVAAGNSLLFTGGISLNNNFLRFSRLSSYPVRSQTFSYYNEMAPRFSVLKKFKNDLSLLASVSRGFSPPTIAELLPSTGIIETGLRAEHGYNYELTARQFLLRKKLLFEATGFQFTMNQALVQRRDASGADFFTNAGKINQSGIELLSSYLYVPTSDNLVIDHMYFKAGYTYSHFLYKSFEKDGRDYSGKQVPGIPANTFSLNGDLYFRGGWYLNGSYFGASRIFMNDANTTTSNAYHLLGFRTGRKFSLSKVNLNLYAGADNLLDEIYSLGNDINAAGGRYYNAAPRRNFYAGISIGFYRPKS
jgi:iron complex outermembrane receptor protein